MYAPSNRYPSPSGRTQLEKLTLWYGDNANSQYLLFACVRLPATILLPRASRVDVSGHSFYVGVASRRQHATNATAQSLQGARFIQCTLHALCHQLFPQIGASKS